MQILPITIKSRSCAFSLIELIIVIGLLGVLVSLTLSAIQRTREAAARAGCSNNMRQIGLAIHNFEAREGRIPDTSKVPWLSRDPMSMASWHARILSDLDQGALYNQMAAAYKLQASPYTSPHRSLGQPLNIFACPSDSRLLNSSIVSGVRTAFTSYVGVSGSTTGERDGMFGNRPSIRLIDVTDGLSQTFMTGERPPPNDFAVGWWYTNPPAIDGVYNQDLPIELALVSHHPECQGSLISTGTGTTLKIIYSPGNIFNHCDVYHYWSLHTGGSNFLLADGSVRFITYRIDLSSLRSLATRASGDLVANLETGP